MNRNTNRYFAAKMVPKTRRHVDVEMEIKILNQFRSHKNIVTLHEVFADEEETVLILEFVSEGELLDMISCESVTEYDIACVVKQVCQALRLLHHNNIVHMDVKPENILISKRKNAGRLSGKSPNKSDKPSVRLADFGLARYVRGDDESHPVAELGGTPEFVAPELLHSGDLSSSIDMWCVGVTTYICLTGISPFQGDTDKATVSNIVNCQYYDGKDLFGRFTNESLDFIKKLLVLIPEERMSAMGCLAHPWLSKRRTLRTQQMATKINSCGHDNQSFDNNLELKCDSDAAVDMLQNSLESLRVPSSNVIRSSPLRSNHEPTET